MGSFKEAKRVIVEPESVKVDVDKIVPPGIIKLTEEEQEEIIGLIPVAISINKKGEYMTEQLPKNDSGAEMLQPREQDMSEEAVRAVVAAGRVKVVPGIVCVDGGVTKVVKDVNGKDIEYAGMSGFAGADMTMVSALAAYKKEQGKDFDPEKDTLAVVEATKKVHGEFHLHTDSHAEHKGKTTGCGDQQGKCEHEFSSDYGVDPDLMVSANKLVQNMAETDDAVVNQMLDRSHAERGVLVNTGETHTVVHWITPEEFEGEDEGVYGQFFVADLDHASRRRIAVYEELGYSQEMIDRLEEIAGSQASVTNRRLALGKPVYIFNVDDQNSIQVTFKGWIDSKGEPSGELPKETE